MPGGILSTALGRLVARSSWPAWGFAVTFVLAQLLGKHVILSGLAGTGIPNHVTPLTALDAALLLLFTPLVALGILAIEESARRPNPERSAYVPSTNRRALWAVYTGVIVLTWAPWLIAFYPGGLPLDTIQAVGQCAGNWDNHHPIGFTLIAKMFIDTGVELGSPNMGLFFYALVQSVIMAAVLAYGVSTMASRGAPKWYCWSSIAFFSLAAAMPAFAISMVKDVPFSLAVVGMTYFLFQVVESNGAILRTRKSLWVFAAIALCIMLIRNNGPILVVGLIPVVGLVFREHAMKFVAIGIGLVVCIVLLHGPGFAYLGVSSTRTTTESLGPALQQIGYIASSGGRFTQSQRDTLSQVLPWPLWSELYDSEIVDPLKSHGEFNGQYLNENLPQFLAAWSGVVAANPVMAVEAYMLGTYGYWAAFDDHPNWAPWVEGNELGIQRTEILPREIVARLYWIFIRTPRAGGGFPSEGLFFWVMAASFTVLALQRRRKLMLVLLPCFLLWLMLMLGTPTAYGLRYVLPLALCAPLFAFLPFYRSEAPDAL